MRPAALLGGWRGGDARPRVRRWLRWRVACDAVRGSAGCSISMDGRRDRQGLREMEHYGPDHDQRSKSPVRPRQNLM